MRKQTFGKCVWGVMAACLLLGGCKDAREVPALIEPVAANQSFRPVERRNIGKIHVSIGNVVAAEDCYYYKKVTTIKEIRVNVGQRVEEGDILATADLEALENELEDISDQRAYFSALHDANQPLYPLRLDLIDVDKRSYVNREDGKSAAECDNKTNLEKENYLYDEKLFEYQMRQLAKRAEEVREQIADATLRATRAGVVTYIKNTGKNNVARINEVVVIVADENDVYIETPDQTTEVNKYKKYEVKYALIDGKEIPVTEVEYTDDETIYARAQRSYPCIRYKTQEPTDLKPGNSVVLCFFQKDRTRALCVGSDSLNSDDVGNYVYVKGNGDELEKRYVLTGASDDYYTEILDGLEEGEAVFYVQEIASPVNYKEYRVESREYTQTYMSLKLREGQTLNQAYFAPCLGTVKEIRVDQGKRVKKGDVLMVIDTGGGASAIQEIVNEKNRIKADYDKTVNSLDGQLYDTTAQKEITTIEAGMFHMCEPDYLFAMERAQIQQKMAVYQKEVAKAEYEGRIRQCNRRLERVKKDNDGAGLVSVVAEEDGMISRIHVKEGALIKENGENHLLLSCAAYTPDIVAVSVNTILSLSLNGRVNGVCPIGAKVRIVDSEDDSIAFSGVCVSNAWDTKSYAFTEEDGRARAVTISDEDNKENYFYVKMDDPEFLEKLNVNKAAAYLDTMQGENMIAIPARLLYKEESKTDKKEKYFVWKLQDGNPVKQYVIRGTEYGLGNETETVILQGISNGDILADEGNHQ